MTQKLYLRDTNGDGLWRDATTRVRHFPTDLELEAAGKLGMLKIEMKSHRNGVAFASVPVPGMEAIYYDHDFYGTNQHKYYFAGYLGPRDREPVPEGVDYTLTIAAPERQWKTHIPHIQFAQATYPTEKSRITGLFAAASSRFGLLGTWDASSQVETGDVTWPTGEVSGFHRKSLGQILDEIRSYPGQTIDSLYPVPVREVYVRGEWVDPTSVPTSGILWVVYYYSAARVQQETIPLTDRPDRMADYAADSFNRANSTTSIGTADTYQAWSNLIGTLGINGNRAYVVGAAADNIAVLNAGVADCEVQVTFAQWASLQRLAFRVTSLPVTAYKWEGFVVQAETGIGYRLFRYQAGGFTQLGSTYSTTPANGDVVKVVTAGTSISVYLNGALIITATSSFNQTATLHGLDQQGGSSAQWDAFSVRAQAALHYNLTQKLDDSSAINIQPIAGPGSDPAAVKWTAAVGVSGEEDGSLTKTADTGAWDAGAVSEQPFTEDGGYVAARVEQTWKVQENFDRPDDASQIGRAGSGQDWEAAGSGAVWGIETGKARPVSITTAGYAVIDSKVSTAIVQVILSKAVTGARLVARFVDTNNMYFLQAEASSYRLYRRQAGADINLGTASVTPADGDILKLVLSDQTIQVYYAATGGTPAFQFQATGQSPHEGATKHGLGATSAATTARFDDFNVWQTYLQEIFGLTDAAGVTTHTHIDYGWLFKADRTARVEEAGTEIGATALTYTAGDAFKVEVRQTQVGATLVPVVKYYRWLSTDTDWVEVYTSLVTPTIDSTHPFYAGGAIYHRGGTIANVTVRRFTYGVYQDADSIAAYGPYPAGETIYDDTLDSEAKRKARAEGVFARHPVLETIYCDTLQEYTAGRTLLLNVTKFSYTNRRYLVPNVKPAHGKSRLWKYRLTLGNRRRELNEKEPLGFLLRGIPDDREGPPVPSGLNAADRDGAQDSPTTVNERITWTQATHGEQWIWVQVQRVGQQWQPAVRFSAERNQAVIPGLVPNAPYNVRIQAQGYNGRYSTWSAADEFVSALLDVPAPPTTLTFPEEGASGPNNAWLRVSWPHSTYSRRLGYQLRKRLSNTGVLSSNDPIVFVPPDQNSVVLRNLSVGVSYDYDIRTLHESGLPGPWLTPAIAHTVTNYVPGPDPPDWDEQDADSPLAGWKATAAHTSTTPPATQTTDAFGGRRVLALVTGASQIAEVESPFMRVEEASEHIAGSANKLSAGTLAGSIAAHFIDWYDGASTPALISTSTVYNTQAQSAWPADGSYIEAKVTAPSGAKQFKHRLRNGAGSRTVLFSRPVWKDAITNSLMLPIDIETNPLTLVKADGAGVGRFSYDPAGSGTLKFQAATSGEKLRIEASANNTSLLFGGATGEVGARLDAISGLTSDIMQFLVNGSLKAQVDKDGIFKGDVFKGWGGSFPGSPSSGWFFYNTTHKVWAYYDGSRWLGATQLPFPFYEWDRGTVPYTTNGIARFGPILADYAMYLEKFFVSARVGTTNNGSNYWTIELRYETAGGADTSLGSVNTSAMSIDTWTKLTLTPSTQALSASDKHIYYQITKTGAPGAIFPMGGLRFRHIYT